jgi:hypothetical protein
MWRADEKAARRVACVHRRQQRHLAVSVDAKVRQRHAVFEVVGVERVNADHPRRVEVRNVAACARL